MPASPARVQERRSKTYLGWNVEAFNRHCRGAFLSELAVSGLTTLDAINEAFIAWGAQYYNVRVHGETGEAPIERWKAAKHVHHIEEETMRVAFLFKDSRKTDKAGIFSLFGTRYQVGANLLNRRIVVRYDPEQLDEVEVWTTDDRFVQRVRPFEVQQHRRPRPAAPAPAADTEPATSGIDWLGHLTKQHQDDKVTAPQRPRRADLDDAIVSLLREQVDDAVFDEVVVRDFLQRFGPFETAPATVALKRWMQQQPSDLHITAYLQAIRTVLGGA